MQALKKDFFMDVNVLLKYGGCLHLILCGILNIKLGNGEINNGRQAY